MDLLSFYIKIGLTNYSDIDEYQKSENQKQDFFQRKQKKSTNKFVYDVKGKRKRSNSSRRKKITQGFTAFNKVFLDYSYALFPKRKKKSTFIEKVKFFFTAFLTSFP